MPRGWEGVARHFQSVTVGIGLVRQREPGRFSNPGFHSYGLPLFSIEVGTGAEFMEPLVRSEEYFIQIDLHTVGTGPSNITQIPAFENTIEKRPKIESFP